MFLLSIGCASNPYKVCDDEITTSGHNQCLQNVQAQENQRMIVYQNMQQQLIQQQQFQQQNLQMQMPTYQQPTYRAPVQTNCTRWGNQVNCTSN